MAAESLPAELSLPLKNKNTHCDRVGKLYRGCRISANVSSIPTKYQTVVICNTERKGFSSQTKRFLSETNQNENPGPGSYISHKPAEPHSSSFSKKGTGSFASRTARVPRNGLRPTPAPNAYTLQSTLLERHSFNLGSSSMFQQPIAVKLEDVKSSTPAPNQYNVSLKGIEKSTTVSAKSVFLSKTQREFAPPGDLKVPSPCHYRVNDSLTKESPKVPVSCFRSTSERIQTTVPAQVPGPGACSPYEAPGPVKKTIFPKRHYLCISAPPIPVPKTPPPPGPGHYEVVNYEGAPRHYMSSAVFLSNTSRWTADNHSKDLPGPGLYHPEKPTKQSFLYNFSNKWIPA
uniref:Sperm-tail PG-rich repeat containing 1 n=1 Tax=Lepisosteus oculatus TaxID=7918 RepID=W5M4S9_LEPOC|nr:PREDICTED: O(6)-methylguanine-induced apoptosis 2 [Lepisosteus oculatus]XP_015204280.1 PREDICTED: O(6)-methylguanine-induced apoptosis 2 [Lepisosteus oculatus]